MNRDLELVDFPDGIINARILRHVRTMRQRVQVVEKLLELAETIKLEKLESLYDIPSDWLLLFLDVYVHNEVAASIYFSIPSEIVARLDYKSDNRVIWRHVKRVLQARYKESLDVM